MDFFTRKWGALPVWAWATIGIGGFVVWRLKSLGSASSQSAAQPNTLYGGELSPEQQPGYPGQFSLTPDSLLPVSALSGTSNPQAGTPSVANAPPVAPNPGPRAHPIFHTQGGFVATGPAPAPGGGPGGEGRVPL